MLKPFVFALLAQSALACGTSAAPGIAELDASTDSADAGDADAAQLQALWVGAHPDDELFVAPQFAADCIEQSARCAVLVLTRGENGKCKRPAECAAGLAATRTRELQKSAARLGADVEQWDFADLDTGPTAVVQSWATAAGGEQALLQRIRNLVQQRNPKVIYTFDPRHGTTCHSAHRAASALLYLALKGGAFASRVRFLQSRPEIDAAASLTGIAAMVPADSNVVRFDATRASLVTQGDLWGYLPGTMAEHASQFNDAELRAARAVPAAGRAVFWLSAERAQTADPRYENICP